MKHILEIPESAVTVFVTVRENSGKIHSGCAKGEPHYTEALALAFGAFVSVLKAVEKLDQGECDIVSDIRKAIQTNSLEECRRMFTNIASATRSFLDDQKEDGK